MPQETAVSTAELYDRLAVLQRDVEELARTTKALVRERFAERGEAAAEFCEKGLAEARDLELAIKKCIAENPLTALAAAAGIGFLIGKLGSRR